MSGRRRAASAAAAALMLLAPAVSGCALSKGSTSTAAGSTVPAEPAAGAVRTVDRTRVQVVQGIGTKGGFDAPSIYRLLGPGVVTVISTYGTSNQAALGSGFVLDGNGFIATNAHVVLSDPPKLTRASNVYIEFGDGNRVPATIVGDDLNSDVALLKVNPAGLSLTPLQLGSSANLTVGEPVAAIGSPFGENESLSVGVISATGRDIESLTAFRIPNAIQTDAAINHGNSGGPLIDGHGTVVGINSQIQSSSGGGEGVGFAVPIDTVRRSLAQLRATGHVNYAFLGVTTQDLYPQLAARLGLATTHGALIASVAPGSPSEAAGLKAGTGKIDFESDKGIPAGGDAITAVDGAPVNHAASLTSLIGMKDPGQTVTLTVVRGTSQRQVTVKLGSRPASSSAG